MKVVVGLGNPGKQYEHTPHNVGFEVVDELSARCGGTLRRSFRFQARMASAKIGEHDALLVQPRSFMNQSGGVVAGIVHKYNLSLDDLFIILDDADLPMGRLRLRKHGSAGGHKGLRSVIECLGSDRFARLRIGIGRRQGTNGESLIEHVLTPFPAEQKEDARKMILAAADAVETSLQRGMDEAMNVYNAS